MNIGTRIAVLGMLVGTMALPQAARATEREAAKEVTKEARSPKEPTKAPAVDPTKGAKVVVQDLPIDRLNVRIDSDRGPRRGRWVLVEKVVGPPNLPIEVETEVDRKGNGPDGLGLQREGRRDQDVRGRGGGGLQVDGWRGASPGAGQGPRHVQQRLEARERGEARERSGRPQESPPGPPLLRPSRSVPRSAWGPSSP